MLNELYLIRNGLAEINHRDALTPVHNELREPGKSYLLRVVLEPGKEDGSISEVEFLRGNKNKNYWTQGDGNKNQFPAVKLRSPLRPEGVEKFGLWKKEHNRPKPEQLLDCLGELRQDHPICPLDKPWPDYREKLRHRADLYRNKLTDGSRIVSSLLDLFLKVEEDALLDKLDKKLWEECRRNPDKDMLGIAGLILFANGEELTSGCMKDGKRPTLLFDLKNENTQSAANKHWKGRISSVLYGADVNNKKGTCAISGKQDVQLVSGTFPYPQCNKIGKVILFSRKKEVETYARYGKKGAESLNISQESSDEMAAALRYLNDKDEGTTWDSLPRESGKNDDLLLAFCRAGFDIDETIIKLLTYDEDDYERESKQICESFRGQNIDLTVEPVDFMILRKINDGVQKVIFSSSQSRQRLGDASESWTLATKNAPLIPKLSGTTPKPLSLSPKQFAYLFRKHYTGKNNLRSVFVPGLPFAEVMTLFMSEQCDLKIAKRMLGKLLKQFSSLLEEIALGERNPERNHRLDARRSVSVIAILLYKLNRKKEVYMNELAYKLGQFCSVLDEIHTGYCYSERNGETPSRLVGNQAYSAAILNPIKALEITAQRFAVYKAWAERNSHRSDDHEKLKCKKVKNAKYAYFWFRDNCADLHSLVSENLPVATPASKAELLLGYLAGRPYSEEHPYLTQIKLH